MSTLAEWLLEQITVDEARAPDEEQDDPYVVQRVSEKRMLAECEAKRRIVELHHPVKPVFGKPCCGICADTGGTACATLRALGLPYADRPGYREEWRP